MNYNVNARAAHLLSYHICILSKVEKMEKVGKARNIETLLAFYKPAALQQKRFLGNLQIS